MGFIIWGQGELVHFAFNGSGPLVRWDKVQNISYIDTPEDIRDTYQYFTEADMSKFKSTGCPVVFQSFGRGNNGLCSKLSCR